MNVLGLAKTTKAPAPRRTDVDLAQSEVCVEAVPIADWIDGSAAFTRNSSSPWLGANLATP
jgi:hypothetical protein